MESQKPALQSEYHVFSLRPVEHHDNLDSSINPKTCNAGKTMRISKLKLTRCATYRALLMFILIGFISGCAVKIVYNQLDWVIPWYLSDYMSLNSEQKNTFNDQLDRYLNWHRQTQLPLYGDFLNRVADKLNDGMTETSLSFVQERSRELGHALVKRLAPDMVLLFQGATDQQIAQLFDKFEQENKIYRQDYIDSSEKAQRKKRAKEIQVYVERWTGRLNKKQRGIIREGAAQYQLMGREFLQARRAWQTEFKRVLALRDQPLVYQQALTALLLSEGFGQTEAFHKKFAHNEKVLRALYLKLDKSLTSRQRKKAVNNLRGYARDFYELARRG
ncbi:MAG: hypothetical protein CSA49_00395 [Gammaproteobacteria bacterium]|nr:MAG: hypothetical protein CSA49_00395 [Gammaproteobacteria bacterium]